uniref:Uncharacterized protein n=1 Tax=Arundo donax TaxID=35708 RepID=A0A0A8YQN4_ARUDO
MFYDFLSHFWQLFYGHPPKYNLTLSEMQG